MKRQNHKSEVSQAGETPPLGDTSFRFIGDPAAHRNRALPGVYETTFPVCEVRPVMDKLRLTAQFVMTGPLECQAPRTIPYELDVTGTFVTIREQFLQLGMSLGDADSVDKACKTVLSRVVHTYAHRYVDEHGESRFTSVPISPEEAKARLTGLPPSARQMRIAMSLFPSSRVLDEEKWTRADRKKMSRKLMFWASILRCEASPLPGSIGYEVKWEAHLDDYLDAPFIHRWTQRVDNLQAYEELRMDLEVLCVDLESYQDIQKACAKALGQNVITTKQLKEIALVKRSLLEHFTEKPHQLPPLHERMTRAEAEEYVRQHQLDSFAGDLRIMRFVDEGTPTANTEAAPGLTPPSPDPNRPMEPLYRDIFDSYKLVQMPVEPYASESIARVGTYRLRATHCTVRKRDRFYFTHIRLEMACEELDPPFRAVYELNRKLTYTQLCAEFRKLQVMVHSEEGIKPACKSVLSLAYYAKCLPEDAPECMDQNAGLN